MFSECGGGDSAHNPNARSVEALKKSQGFSICNPIFRAIQKKREYQRQVVNRI
jgi:hypothetical protein